MMTLYLAFETIEAGRMSYTTKIKITEEAAAAAPSKLDVDAGTEITALEAFKALVTKSANDVAIALAQHIGGTEQNFARLMTRKAREIGMSHTTFRNASGLPDPEQVTTARDMLTLALRLQDDFPRHYQLFATRSFNYAGHTYRNHNTLLTRYRGTDGIKTGYTRASGFNLVSSVHRDGKHLVAAVFGGDTARERNVKMQSLLNAAFAKASTKVTRKPDRELVAQAPQPTLAKQPRRVADTTPKPVATPPAPEPPAAPEPVRERDTSIAMAKVRRVLIDADANADAATTKFAVAGAAATDTVGKPAGQALPPSTLGAQAAELERNAPAPQAVTNLAPTPDATSKGKGKRARGPFEIQIGAYADSTDAERHMAAARQRANGKLDSYRGIAVPVKSGSGQLYRARFRGFDSTAANDACAQLKRAQIDCFVLKTE
jgi:D-alanyl-D-alanine carboxypeptidase